MHISYNDPYSTYILNKNIDITKVIKHIWYTWFKYRKITVKVPFRVTSKETNSKNFHQMIPQHSKNVYHMLYLGYIYYMVKKNIGLHTLRCGAEILGLMWKFLPTTRIFRKRKTNWKKNFIKFIFQTKIQTVKKHRKAVTLAYKNLWTPMGNIYFLF